MVDVLGCIRSMQGVGRPGWGTRGGLTVRAPISQPWRRPQQALAISALAQATAGSGHTLCWWKQPTTVAPHLASQCGVK